MKKRYVTQSGPDGITWLTLEPFLEDLKEAIVNLIDTNLPLDQEGHKTEKLLGLKATYEILSTVIQQHELSNE